MSLPLVLLIVVIGFIAALTAAILVLCDLIRDVRDGREERAARLYVRENTDPIPAFDAIELAREHMIGGRG